VSITWCQALVMRQNGYLYAVNQFIIGCERGMMGYELDK
jgi:hypothetical protein